MSEYQDTNVQSSAAVPRWVGLAVAALGGISVIGLGVGVSALNEAKSTQQSMQASLKQQNDDLSQKLSKEDEQNQQLQSDLKVVTDKLNARAIQSIRRGIQQETDRPADERQHATRGQGQR